MQTYRVSRVQEAQTTEQSSVRPADFDLAAYRTRSAAAFKAGVPRYLAIPRVAPDLLPRLRRDRIEESGPPDATGWITVTMRFDVQEEACAYALGLDAALARALGPPELLEQMLARASGILTCYASRRAYPTGSIDPSSSPRTCRR